MTGEADCRVWIPEKPDMADHIEKGRKGEEEAARFLIAKGYDILEKNWRYGRKEIDIIALDRDRTVFVEVKSRRSLGDERYDELIGPSKQQSLLAVANAYMVRRKKSGPVRFDVVFVIGEGPGTRIEHIEDAFDNWG